MSRTNPPVTLSRKQRSQASSLPAPEDGSRRADSQYHILPCQKKIPSLPKETIFISPSISAPPSASRPHGSTPVPTPHRNLEISKTTGAHRNSARFLIHRHVGPARPRGPRRDTQRLPGAKRRKIPVLLVEGKETETLDKRGAGTLTVKAPSLLLCHSARSPSPPRLRRAPIDRARFPVAPVARRGSVRAGHLRRPRGRRSCRDGCLRDRADGVRRPHVAARRQAGSRRQGEVPPAAVPLTCVRSGREGRRGMPWVGFGGSSCRVKQGFPPGSVGCELRCDLFSDPGVFLCLSTRSF